MSAAARRCLALAVLALSAAPWTALQAAPPDGPSFGLIVKLRDDPAHEQAKALGAPAAADEPVRRERLSRVLGAQAAQLARAAPAGARIERPVGRAHLVGWDRPLSPQQAEQAAEALTASGDVEWVEYNTLERRLLVPNDPRYSEQWWLRAVATGRNGVPGMPTAWDRSVGDPVGGTPYVAVAVLDTGALFGHPDLSSVWLGGYDFVSEVGYSGDGNGRDADASDPGDYVTQADRDGNPSLFSNCAVEESSWHGSKIAGQIAAQTNNLVGVAGLNWRGRVVPVRVAGKCGATVADIADAIRWAAGATVSGVPANPNPVKVINLSFGGTGSCSATYQDAIDAARARGAVLVAAAGNESGAVTRPANCRGVVAVAALNQDGFKTNYSNFGSAVTVSTVGGDPRDLGICGPYLGDDGLLTTSNAGARSPSTHDYDAVAGTSFSAPVVAGVISLMQAEASTALTPDQVIDGLERSARPHVLAPDLGTCASGNAGRCQCTTSTCGAGILDAEQALVFAADPTNYTAPSRQAVTVDNEDTQACADAVDDNGGGDPPDDDDDGGGGALGWEWLAALGLAAALTARSRRREAAR
ncbi:S8 family peptidase [Schlegelella sp. S2-27]|uniref:S8 family peptidase n=1 Tax=Caldimonas mangrovi TaxID=2944811 RepID=A0ABT0YKM1_9BURK|nr:S8 family peptidase [Caldimonas mangrovi]MCM5679280.1 S8 family peptidase [Caldimonas mangrovi]